jgi:pyridoxal phosphate enzyme (YggS family)
VSRPVDTGPGAGPARRDELASALARVEERIAAACGSAGRPRAAVTLVVVTKTFPAEDVRLLAGLGVREVGESRDQEAEPKAAALADLALSWHFVGRLQSNKAASVAAYASVVQSVDRSSLIAPLARGAARAERESLGVLLQVSLDGDPERGGLVVGPAPGYAGLLELAGAVTAHDALALRGVMAVAPLGADPSTAFARLVDLSAALQREHPQADWVSAGMSGDLEAAVTAGATHLRVGSAILGSRPPLG